METMLDVRVLGHLMASGSQDSEPLDEQTESVAVVQQVPQDVVRQEETLHKRAK